MRRATSRQSLARRDDAAAEAELDGMPRLVIHDANREAVADAIAQWLVEAALADELPPPGSDGRWVENNEGIEVGRPDARRSEPEDAVSLPGRSRSVQCLDAESPACPSRLRSTSSNGSRSMATRVAPGSGESAQRP